MKAHPCEFVLSKRHLADIVIVLAMKKQRLCDWLQNAVAAGLDNPPRFAFKLDTGEAESLRAPLDDDALHAAWDLAKAASVDSGENFNARDVMSVLVTRQARKDILAMRDERREDFDFLAQQFGGLSTNVEREKAVVDSWNAVFSGCETRLFVTMPVREVNAQAQAKQNAEREAEQQRLMEAQQAEAVALAAERNRLNRLLAV